MELTEFENLVAEAVAALPEKFQAKLKNVAFVVGDEPSIELRQREKLNVNETLLGYYQGIPLTRRGGDYGMGPTLPDVITIFQGPIENAAGEAPAAIRRIVFETVSHEVAHYFGMNEHEVRAREKKKHGRW